MKLTLSPDCLTAFINGADDNSRCQIFSTDGRLVADMPVTGGTVSLAALAQGNYIMRVIAEGEAPFVNHFIKRQ